MQKTICVLSLTLGFGLSAFAQEAGAPGKTPKSTVLIFKEDFKVGKGEIQLGQDSVTNPNVEMKLYGPGAKPGKGNESGLLMSAEEDTVHPGKMESYIFTGVVEASWGVMLKDKNNYMDLRDTGRIIWRTRARSLHELRLLVKLADGTMWASDYTERLSTYMHESEVFFTDIQRWRQINPETMEEARAKAGEPLWKTNLDLSKVDEIGFSDLMAGAGHGTQGNVAVDWIEVYGNPVKRAVSTSQAR